MLISECAYKKTCPNKTDNCEERTMTEIHAKPIVDGKFWIVEKDGNKIATLHKKENNKFVLSSTNGEVMFNKKEDLQKQFGKEFFLKNTTVKVSTVDVTEQHEVHGFPAMCKPYNSMYDVRRKLPLFTKSNASKSLYCAGYYTIKFEKGWVRSFCPKLITIERYDNKGPFKNEFEMKAVLANAKSS
jgi:hypothetical protein